MPTAIVGMPVLIALSERHLIPLERPSPSAQSLAECRNPNEISAGRAHRFKCLKRKRIRFTMEPPYLSSRLFDSGD